MLYNPTSQDEGLDTDDPEVDWDNVDWDYATDVDPCIASGDGDFAPFLPSCARETLASPEPR